jgi:CRP-like cAMP-binding protein
MLQGHSEFVRDCFERAARAREAARTAVAASDKEEYLAQEQRWLTLARSETLSERVSRFLSSRGTSRPRRDLVIPIFRDAAFDADDLHLMCEVFDRTCGLLGISNSDPLYEFVGRIIVEQAQSGVKPTDLEAATLRALDLKPATKSPIAASKVQIAKYPDPTSLLYVARNAGLPLQVRHYEPEQVLVTEGERVDRVHFAESAVFSVRMLMADQIMEVASVGTGAGVGCVAALDRGQVHTRAVVLIGGQGFSCSADRFREAALENQQFFQAALRQERRIAEQTSQRAVCNITHLLEQRLASWLARLHDISGRTEFGFTQEQVAEWLGAQRSSLSIAASRLRSAGAIAYARGAIRIISLHELQTAACRCSRS